MSPDYTPVQNLMYFKLCIVTCSMYICVVALRAFVHFMDQCLLTKLLGDGTLDAVFCCWYAQSGGAVVRNSFC